MIPILFVLVVSALASLTFTPLVRNLARSRGWLDRPDGQRKLHHEPVPRLGGVAIFGAFLASSGLLLVIGAPAPWSTAAVLSAYGHLLVAAAAVLALGVVDDLRGVSPAAKVLVQALAGGYLYANGYRVDAISNPFGAETVALGWLALPVTLLWFIAMSNAFNLIDGLDGLAAGVGFFSTTTLFIASVVNERWEVALLSAALGGALLGFLRYNFNPASIFLGDSGSLFVGFALAAFAIRGSMKSSAAIAVVAPLLALAVPIVDAGIAIVRRIIRGRRVFEADGDHIHHRLLRRGLKPRSVVFVLYGIAAAFGVLSLLTMTTRSQVVGLVVIASSVVTWIGIQQLGYSEFAEVQRVLRQGLFSERRAIPKNLYLRSLREQFERCEELDQLRRLLLDIPGQLGFWRLELQCGPAASSLGSDWATGDARPAAEPSARLTIPLVPEALGAVQLLGPISQPDYQLHYLADALREGFGPRLGQLLGRAVQEGASGPAAVRDPQRGGLRRASVR